MPYKNIVFVKLLWKELLHEDTRFVETLDDSQKGLYLMLLLLAGATNNNIKNDEKYVKRVLNLTEKTEKIRENLDVLLTTFPKLISKNGFLKFKKFNELHNYIRKSKGLPEDCPGDILDKNRIDKIRKEQIYEVSEAFVKTKRYDRDSITPDNWKRYQVAANKLLQATKGDTNIALQAIKWAETFDFPWTLETVVKKYPDFKVSGASKSVKIRDILNSVKKEEALERRC